MSKEARQGTSLSEDATSDNNLGPMQGRTTGIEKDAVLTNAPEASRSTASQVGPPLIIFAMYFATLGVATYALSWVPAPLPIDADAKMFSEDRALLHVAHLSNTIGDRLVGTPGVEIAAQYVQQQVESISRLAQDHLYLTAQVDREQVSGSVDAEFAGVAVASAYQNLSNVMLYIAPKLQPGQVAKPALLMNSHFDSVFGTNGASDCASCVGVMLEVARALVSDPEKKLQAPLLFLFNGGEETLLLAAHGFMAHSKWADKVGAFINLESTGPGGPAYLFQHTGGWAVQAYAKASKYPHGSVCGQDFFETRILAMDTDFRMFSSQYHGTLPGIDIAYIMDGAAYHTHQDTIDRIRKGTVQASGENILAAVETFTEALSDNITVASQPNNAVFFDLYGRYMVTYSGRVGKILHTTPLALWLIVVSQIWQRRQPAGKSGTPELTVRSIWKGTLKQGITFLLAVAFPAAGGFLRVLISGKSMVWFGSPLLLALTYAPLAFAGLLWQAVWSAKRSTDAQSQFYFGLGQAMSAAGLTALGLKSGYLSASWAVAALLGYLILQAKGLSAGTKFYASLLFAAPAALLTAPFAIGLPVFVMEHISIAGAAPDPIQPFVADLVLGIVMGVVVYTTGSYYATWLRQVSVKLLRAIFAILVATSVSTMIYSSLYREPYSREFPKRVVLQHLHQLDNKGELQSSRWAIAAMDSIPIHRVLPAKQTVLPGEATDFLGLYPLTKMIRGVKLEAPQPNKDVLGSHPTYLDIVKVREQKRSPGTWRIIMELRTSQPAWGSFNVTGRILGWSFSEVPLQKAAQESKQISRMVRFAGNDRRWQFWIDTKVTEEVHINASVLFMDETPEIKGMIDSLPGWINAMPFTGFQRSFTF